MLFSANGVLDLLVIARQASIAQFLPYRATGWVYDICLRPTDGSRRCPVTAGSANLYGGSRLQLSPGDLLKIRLVNQLPPNTGAAYANEGGEEFLALNPTNLHLHGVLASPRYATADDATWGDNIFVYNFNSANGVPAPGSNLHGTALFDVADYSIPIPLSHPSGLYWFHPHIHGISQNQISAGLSGIITIGHVADYGCARDKCGPGDAASAITRHLILKDSQILEDGTLQSQVDSGFCGRPTGTPGQGGCAGSGNAAAFGNAGYSGGRWFFTINGQQYPTITVGAPAGQLWRIVNASASATYHLDLWDEAEQRDMLMQVISIDGTGVDVGPGTDASRPIERSGNRFQAVPCPGGDGFSGAGVCTASLHLMPSARAEVWVTYRDASGAARAPPPGARAVLRTSGYWAGPEGDTWPAIDLAKVPFLESAAPATDVAVTQQVPRLTDLQGISADLRAANSDVPGDADCKVLAPGHARRIFFNVTATVPHRYGLGYEEIDENGEPVPGTFVDVAAFDPTTPTVCVPLAEGNVPVTERWELVNLQGTDHNFHMHQVHFTVLSEAEVGGTAVPDRLRGRSVMMDSLPLPHADGTCNSVAEWRGGACRTHPATVEIGFAIAGDFVYHCHISAHEDGGMMALIRVRSSPSLARADGLGRMLSALHLTDGGRKQPMTPRIGGVICRTPRSPPVFGSETRAAP